MPLSLYSLDKFVSQKLSEFTSVDFVDVKKKYDQSNHWLANFILNSIFINQINNKEKQFFFVFIRRSEMAFIEYENCQHELNIFLSNRTSNVTSYFRGLYHAELTLSNLYQAYSAFMKFSGEKLFESGDGSEIQKLNYLYNVSKHVGFDLLPENNLHPIWLNNDGIHCTDHTLTWKELANILDDVGGFADKLSKIDVGKNEE